MRKRLRLWLCSSAANCLLGLLGLLGLPAQAVMAGETPLPAALNLPQEAGAAYRQGMPLILLVSLPDCPYCEQVRKQHLAPLHKQGVLVRQVYINSEASVAGFDGKPVSQRQLAISYAVKAAPTVLFLDAQGRSLAPPIVGALLEDFYGAYLDEAIAAAKQQLAQIKR